MTKCIVTLRREQEVTVEVEAPRLSTVQQLQDLALAKLSEPGSDSDGEEWQTTSCWPSSWSWGDGSFAGYMT